MICPPLKEQVKMNRNLRTFRVTGCPEGGARGARPDFPALCASALLCIDAIVEYHRANADRKSVEGRCQQ